MIVFPPTQYFAVTVHMRLGLRQSFRHCRTGSKPSERNISVRREAGPRLGRTRLSGLVVGQVELNRAFVREFGLTRLL